MKPERARLKRALLLERVRRVEKRARANDATAAEDLRTRLALLARRSADLAGDYGGHLPLRDARELRDRLVLAAQLRAMAGQADTDATRAKQAADERLAALGTATRRHAEAQDRAQALARQIAEIRAQAASATQTRRPSAKDLGTDFG